MKQRIFTLRQIYREGTSILKEAGIEEASLDAWYLLEYVTGISKADYYGDPEHELEIEQAEEYLRCIGVRKNRIPLQHITGEQEFMGYPFCVNEYVLIPRQDTEVLVEEAVRVIRGGTDRRLRVLDMCTGSGCILLSIMKICPQVAGVGCDISEEALAVARKNAERLTVEAEFLQGDLFQNLDSADSDQRKKYDLIVSNPPYIRTAEIEELQEEVRLHDPRLALDGREDGMFFYKRIVADSIHYITDGGYLMFEIGCDQAEDVKKIMNASGYEDIMVKKDLAGLDRVVIGRYNKVA